MSKFLIFNFKFSNKKEIFFIAWAILIFGFYVGDLVLRGLKKW